MDAKGDCYEVHYRFLLDHLGDGEQEGWTLCHGTVTNAEGRSFGHCWLEHDGFAYDFSNGLRTHTPATKYQEILQARDVTSYTFDEATTNGVKYRHTGPWP